jgi:AcrR family transcriptional regulator
MTSTQVPGVAAAAAARDRSATEEHGGPSGARAKAGPESRGRVNQKQRTRMAIVEATRRLAGRGGDISMPVVAREALVSEATAYRYFPDLATLLREADEGTWPSPAAALAPVADSDDPVERIGYAAEVLFRAPRAPVRADRLRPRPAGPHAGADRPRRAGAATARPGRRDGRRSAVQPDGPVRAGTRGGHRQRRAHGPDRDPRGGDRRVLAGAAGRRPDCGPGPAAS